MKYLVPIGRILFSLMFIMAGFANFSKTTIGYAASQGVPIASLAVPLSGLIAVTGGLSIALGFQTKWGAWLIVLFLIPVTFTMHAFWKVQDPMMFQMQFANFMKNISMLGGALTFAYYGAGPVSIDARSELSREAVAG